MPPIILPTGISIEIFDTSGDISRSVTNGIQLSLGFGSPPIFSPFGHDVLAVAGTGTRLSLGAATAATNRPVIANGTIETPKGARLRGSPINQNIRAQTTPPVTLLTHWQTLKAAECNFSRVDVKTGDVGRTVAQQLAHIDNAVNNASQAGMYMSLMNTISPGNYNLTQLLDFWGTCADRYKDRQHVFYEITNEPVNNGPYWGLSSAWTDAKLTDLIQVHDVIRSNAPDTIIAILSSANIATNAQAWVTRPIQRWEALSGGVDWTKTIIAFHHYGGTLRCTLSGGPPETEDSGWAAINYIRDLGYPLYCSETNDWHNDVLAFPEPYLSQMKIVLRGYEENRMSWCFLDGDLSFSHLIPKIMDLHDQGYYWGGEGSSDPNLISAGKTLLGKLVNLPQGGTDRVYSGQLTFASANRCYDTTGYWPMVLAEAVIDGEVAGFATVSQDKISDMIAHATAGGIVMDECRVHNLLTRATMTTGTATDAEIIGVITPGTVANNNFKEWFDAYATAMQQLEAAGVPVIITPWRSMNFEFWYRNRTPSVITQLWQYTWDYLVNVKGCHNLIFAFAPHANPKNATTYWPGDDYVDIAGLLAYPDLRTAELQASYFTDYAGLVATAKPFALLGFGPKPATVPSANADDGRYDRLVAGLKNVLPKTTFWVSKTAAWSMTPEYQGGTTARLITLLSDPWIKSRNEDPLPSAGEFDPYNLFIAESAHHRPIGSGAAFAGSGSAFLNMWNLWPSNWGDFNRGSPYGCLYYVVNSVTSPKVTIALNPNGDEPPRGIPVSGIPHPPQVVFATNTDFNDSSVVFIEEDTGKIHEFRECRATTGTVATPSSPMQARSYRPHWAVPNGAADTGVTSGLGHGRAVGNTTATRVGHTAAGISFAFGLLLRADLDRNGPIGHILQCVFPSRVGDGGATAAQIVLGKSIILPASTRDGFCDTAAYCTGPVPYGGILSLPTGVNIYNRGFNALQIKFAECVRDYGILAIDTGGNFAIRTDQNVTDSQLTQLRAALKNLKPDLRLITNGAWDPANPLRPTGGGTARAPNTATTIPPTPTGPRTYTTSFATAENPMVDGGNWLLGQRDGVDWSDVLTTGGNAKGKNRTSPQFADPTAIVSGTWAANQEVSAVAYRTGAGTDRREIELRLRNNLRAGFCNGYEVIFRAYDSPGLIQVVKWPGAPATNINQFVFLANSSGTQYLFSNGSVLRATIIGNTIRAYIDGSLVLTVTDTSNPITSGSPGFGFNYNYGDYSDHGLQSFTAKEI